MKFKLNPRTYKLNRRSFLQSTAFGIQTAVALPLLEGMFKSNAAYAAVAENSTRFFAMYVPNGVIEENWFPKGSKDNWSLAGTSLEAFEKRGVAEDISFYRGLKNSSAGANGRGRSNGNDHLVSIGSWLTGPTIPNDDLNTYMPSLEQDHADHMNAKELGKVDGLPNPDLKCLRMAGNAELDPGRMQYNNQMKNGLNWSKQGKILKLNDNLRGQFDQLYTKGGAGGEPQPGAGAGINRRTMMQISALDDVKADMDALVKRVGASDRQRLELYFDGLRDIELQLDAGMSGSTALDCNPPMASNEVPVTPYSGNAQQKRALRFGDHMHAAAKITAHAMSCGLIHSATYCAGGEAAGGQYADININMHFHNSISHNRGRHAGKHRQIDAFHADGCAHFMQELKKIPLGGGNLLDNTAVMFGSGLGNGDSHTRTDIAMMVGGRFGRFKPGLFHGAKGKASGDVVNTIRAELGMKEINGLNKVDVA